jgi:hypothetical protein
MSALGHKRTFSDAIVTPALALESDIKCVNMECPPVATSQHLSALALTLKTLAKRTKISSIRSINWVINFSESILPFHDEKEK